jgi:hypothetical protein
MYCVLHGIPLPTLGSFEYQLLQAGLVRQRSEKVAFARLLASLIGPLTELEGSDLELMLAGYAEAVSQVRYNYRYTPAHVRVLEERMSLQQEDARLMREVASWK